MGDYKQLNKELIDANRELKQTIALYQKELVLMRAELMEQQRMRVESERDFREHLLSFWAQNCLTFAREIDVNVNLAELLAHNSSVHNANSFVGIREQGDSTRSSRRSTQLVTEFRRSSAVCRPHSVMHVSPTRRHHDDNAIAEETETCTMDDQTGSDMDLDDSINEAVVIDVENDETGDSDENGQLRCISEDSEENCEKLGGTPNRQPIKDLTNFEMEERDPKALVTRRGKHQRRRNDSENSIEFARDVGQDCTQTPPRYTIEMETEDELANSMLRSLHVSGNVRGLSNMTQQTDAHKVVNPFQNEKTYRHLVVRVQRIHEPPQIMVNYDSENCIDDTITPDEENSMDIKRNDDLILGVTAFSMGNFQEASCSTPCHTKAAGVESAGSAESTETTGTLSFNSLAQTTCQSMRPSRRCAPRALTEPNLKVKLRNNSGTRVSRKH